MRNRTVGINIRVTEEEKNRIEKYAKKCKLSVSEYLRQLANNYEPMIYEWEIMELPQSGRSFSENTGSDERSVMCRGNNKNLAN